MPAIELTSMPLVVSPNAKLACMNGAALLLLGPRGVVMACAAMDRLNVEEKSTCRLWRPPSAADLCDHLRQGYTRHACIRDDGRVTTPWAISAATGTRVSK